MEETPTLTESQLSERNNTTQPGKQGNSAFQKRSAVCNLCRRWAILRWGTVDHSGDEHPAELQPILTMMGGWLVCKACLEECTVEEVARAIPGEHPTGSICPMSCRSQSDDEELCLWIAEIRHRSSPVRPSPIGCPFLLGNGGTVLT